MTYRVGQKVKITKVEFDDIMKGFKVGQIHLVSDVLLESNLIYIQAPTGATRWLNSDQVTSVTLSAGEALDWWAENPQGVLLDRNGNECHLGHPWSKVHEHRAHAPYTPPEEE